MAIISWIYYFTQWMKHKWAVSSKSCNNNEAGIQKPTFWVSDGKGTDPKQRVLCPVLPLPSGDQEQVTWPPGKGVTPSPGKESSCAHLPTLPRNGSEGQILTGGLWKLHSSMWLQGIIIIHCYLLLQPQLNPNAALRLCMKTDIALEPFNDKKEFQESMKPCWARYSPLHRRKVLCKLPLLNTERKINPITTGLNS